MTTAAALAVLVVIVAVLAAAVDAGYFRGPLIRFLAARTGRLVQIEGHLETHHDRDVNAAKNILAAGRRRLAEEIPTLHNNLLCIFILIC